MYITISIGCKNKFIFNERKTPQSISFLFFWEQTKKGGGGRRLLSCRRDLIVLVPTQRNVIAPPPPHSLLNSLSPLQARMSEPAKKKQKTLHISAIAEPLADKKLTKKILKLNKKGS